jgi:hypothetical protein
MYTPRLGRGGGGRNYRLDVRRYFPYTTGQVVVLYTQSTSYICLWAPTDAGPSIIGENDEASMNRAGQPRLARKQA